MALWQGSERELNYDLVCDIDNLQCTEARSLLSGRGRDIHDMASFFARDTLKWVSFDDVHLRGIRWETVAGENRRQSTKGSYRVFEDKVHVIVGYGKEALMRKTKEDVWPIFVSTYIRGVQGEQFHLGYYYVACKVGRAPHGQAGDNMIWELRVCPDQVAARRQAMGGESALPVEAEAASAPAPAQPRDRSRSRDRVPPPQVSYKVTLEGYHFESQLEVMHFVAMRQMAVCYRPVRNSFDISVGGSPLCGERKTYTPDGLANLRLLSDTEVARPTQVEIKPGYPTVAEKALMWSLCKVNGVPVMCLYGGQEWIEDDRASREKDYGDRCAPLGISLYLPNSSMQPELHQGLCWLEDAAGFYIGREPSHPDVQGLEQVRHIYRNAFKRARDEVARARHAQRSG